MPALTGGTHRYAPPAGARRAPGPCQRDPFARKVQELLWRMMHHARDRSDRSDRSDLADPSDPPDQPRLLQARRRHPQRAHRHTPGGDQRLGGRRALDQRGAGQPPEHADPRARRRAGTIQSSPSSRAILRSSRNQCSAADSSPRSRAIHPSPIRQNASSRRAPGVPSLAHSSRKICRAS